MTINVFRKGGGGSGNPGGSKSDLYNSFLRSEGYATEVDSDGDIVFKKEGGSYILFAHEGDREYFSVLFPNFWPIETEKERNAAFIAAAHATAGTKGAKVYPLGDNVCASIELLFDEPEQFKPVFNRAMGMLQSGVSSFVAKIKEIT